MTDESPCGMGPFIIMDYVEHAHDLVDALNTPGFTLNDHPNLDPNIPIEKLENLYGQMAAILLQLSTLSLPKIGSPAESDEGIWEVASRPLAFNMNKIVQFGTVPRERLPQKIFSTSSSCYSALADMLLLHLFSQRNDAIEDADDCRRKYVARKVSRT